MKSFKLALNSFSKTEWSDIRRLSQSVSSKLSKMGWWNNKYYEKNENGKDGCKEHKTNWGTSEIPYNREIFKKSNSRFGLGDHPVAYFSNDYASNCCEMIEQLRECENLKWDKLTEYLDGKTNPSPCLIWYPISVTISDDALILDLMNNTINFLGLLADKSNWGSKVDLMEEIILNRDPLIYGETQEISKAAWENGFQGVCYQSVRTPINVVLPDRNLVVFDKSIVLREYC